MQINPVNNTQPNFKGQLVFHNCARLVERQTHPIEHIRKFPIDILSLDSNYIASIATRNINTTKNMLASMNLSPKEQKEDSLFKTIITMMTGEVYEVTADIKKVIDAKQDQDFNNSLKPSEFFLQKTI